MAATAVREADSRRARSSSWGGEGLETRAVVREVRPGCVDGATAVRAGQEKLAGPTRRARRLAVAVDGVEPDMRFRVEVHQLRTQPGRANVVAAVFLFVADHDG